MIDRQNSSRHLFYGGISAGSINLAEILPYLHALTWFHEQNGRQIRPRKVHIMTDSSYVAESGNIAVNFNASLPKTHQPCWAMLREFARLGYVIQFHWRNRSTDLFNVTCDLVASLSRGAIKHAQGRHFTENDLQLLRWIQASLAMEPQTELVQAIQNVLPRLLDGLQLSQSCAANLRENLQQWAAPEPLLQALHPHTPV